MSDIKISRIFHPVGQGAFYTEHFCFRDNDKEQINIVYDCGSTTGKEHVLTQIKKTFRSGENIDAVFISHLHEDHINGIPDLIKRCNVKKIFFPIISDGAKILLKIRMIIDGASKFTRQFIDEPIKAIKELEGGDKIELIGVLVDEGPNLTDSGERGGRRKSDDEDPNPTDSGKDEFEPGRAEECDWTCYSGSEVSVGINPELDFWTYIPYNFEQTSRLKELKKYLKNKGFTEAKLIEIGKNPEKYQQKEIPELRGEYKKLPGGLNSNSMTLYSGPKTSLEYSMVSECASVLHECASVLHEFESELHEFEGELHKKNKGCHYGSELWHYGSNLRYRMQSIYWQIYNLMEEVSDRNLRPYFLLDDARVDDYTDAENPKGFQNRYMLIGCLYTGDYNAKDKQRVTELKRKYKRCWPNLGVIQVPHHGSEHNFNKALIKRGLVCVISAGTKNKYEHPSKEVISDISKNKGECYVVTEKGGGLRFDILISFCR